MDGGGLAHLHVRAAGRAKLVEDVARCVLDVEQPEAPSRQVPIVIEAARRRCAGLANVTLAVTAGNSLRAYPDARFDLVHAIDTFPYLVQAGMPLVETHMHEAARVLVSGGDLVIGNWSYRADLERDRAGVERRARIAGLTVVSAGEHPLAFL